jgi:hypothetical protein
MEIVMAKLVCERESAGGFRKILVYDSDCTTGDLYYESIDIVWEIVDLFIVQTEFF